MLIENARMRLTVHAEKQIGSAELFDKRNKEAYADAAYCYSLDVVRQGRTWKSRTVTCDGHEERTGPDGWKELLLTGRFDFEPSAPTFDLRILQLFRLHPQNGQLEEEIRIVNRGAEPCQIADYAFGFRKAIYRRHDEKWANGFEGYTLVPVPHRRRFGHRVDRKLQGYSLQDLLPHMWEHVRGIDGPEGHNLPDHGSEGWVWTDGSRGLLVLKYQPEEIEFSIAHGEMHDGDFCLRFGGAGKWRGDPESSAEIAAGATTAFGVSRYDLVEGGWKEGYYAFRSYLGSKGKKFPESYNPPVHWNELYNLSWRLGDGSTRYKLDQLFREAEIAADMGCESLYLDPGWDTIEGSTVWDERALGITLKDFVTTVREKYGIAVSLHLMSHTNSKTEYAGMYRKDPDGNLVPVWNGAKVCMQSEWKREKTKRVLKLAEAGVAFFMFDFQEAGPACWDRSHGHEVPLKRQSHAEGINEVIRNVKKDYPGIYIEAHDRVTTGLQDYHQLYYQYEPPTSFDENWGFEYMWDSYLDLICGKAVSLYEYNLACEIPLYLHINIGQKSGLLDGGQSVGPDTTRMLAFWWYASTVRHLGIGGVSDPASPLYKKLKAAMKTYMKLQDFFKRGTFFGIDEMAHVHTLSEKDAAVMSFFNLTGTTVRRQIRVTPAEIGLQSIRSVSGVGGAGGASHGGVGPLKKGKAGASFEIELKPLSPALAKVNFQ
jgi:hypothetical protein